MGKIVISIMIIALLVFVACGSNTTGNVVATDKEIGVSSFSSQEEKVDVKTFNVMLKGVVMEPDLIEVNLGDKVVLNVITDAKDFAVTIPGIEVEEIFRDKYSIYYEFDAKEKGIFNFVCANDCPSGITEFDSFIIIN